MFTTKKTQSYSFAFIKLHCLYVPRLHFVFTLHRKDTEKPNAFPLREPEFIKFPMTKVICSSWEKLWLFMSSSQAAVTDTTSGLMLFSCSSNCSLNRIAWSLFPSSFTVDIWREERGWADEILSKYICHHIDCVCCWVHEGDFIY